MKPPVRAAIYCRKSVDKGEGGEFGSIEAQREAGEALITSRRGEGWLALPERYDDLGLSGATLNRPAFQRLLADIAAGLVDAVVVYKFDRLSRSLADFTTTVQDFERRGVAVVSVTQSVDTSTSTGKLMVNLLASFAQFERETTAERVRDKIQATRRRGLWTGGRPPLGYDVQGGRLVVNPTEAEQVREVFASYLRLRSVSRAAEELAERGFTTKSWVNKRGERVGGAPLTKGHLTTILKSPLHVGRIRAGEQIVEGEHEAIVPQASWDAAQELLSSHRKNRPGRSRARTGTLLEGLLVCGACGKAMGPHATHKGERQYAYYVCQTARKRHAGACPGSRVAVREMDAFVVERLVALGADPGLQREVAAQAPEVRSERLGELAAAEKAARGDVSRLEAELGRVGEGARRADVEAALGRARERVAEARQEAAALRRARPDGRTLRAALGAFLPVWAELFPAERRRVLGLLLERIEYDAVAGELTLSFSEAGAALLAAEAAEAAA